MAAEFERRVIKGELPADFAVKAEAFIAEKQHSELAGQVDRKVIELKRLLGMEAAEPLVLGETIEQLVLGDQ